MVFRYSGTSYKLFIGGFPWDSRSTKIVEGTFLANYCKYGQKLIWTMYVNLYELYMYMIYSTHA